MAPTTRSKRSASSLKQPEGPSKKTREPGAPDQSSSRQLSPLEGFATLPHELKTYCINLACWSVTSSSSSRQESQTAAGITTRPAGHQASDSPCPRLDLVTTVSLMSACKSFYAIAVPLLYGSIFISRPSALAALQFALSSRSGLGTLIKNLYVGPIDTLPDWYWPKTSENPSDSDNSPLLPRLAFIRNSLRPEGDAKHLLRWSAEAEQRLLSVAGYELPSKAVCDAVAAAERMVDVDLDHARRSKTGEPLSPVDFVQRVFEVQAALDYYLMATEDEGGDRTPDTEAADDEDSSTYSALVLTGYPASPRSVDPNSSEGNFCIVSRSQLLTYLARPHAVTDRFDHPLIFARSGITVAARTMWDSEPSRYHQLEVSGAERWARLFATSPGALESAGPSLHSILDLLRSVLVQAHRLENLSVAGFLNLAICGGHATTLSFHSLRSLSIGPLPLGWFQPMELRRFEGLKSLRLCGVRLHDAELECIVAMFPTLKRLQVSMASRWRPEHSPSLKDTIARLVGIEDAFFGNAEGPNSGAEASKTLDPGHDRKDAIVATGSNSSEAADSLNSSSQPLVEVKMHPVDLRALLEAQPDPGVRRAWTLGLPLPNQKRRLLLAESLPESMISDWRLLVSEDLYGEGHEWWEEQGGRRTKQATAGLIPRRYARPRVMASSGRI